MLVGVIHLDHLDRLNIEQIGAIYHVHRATVARWIAGARQQQLAGTRLLMLQRINGRDVNFESVMRLIESELEASVCRLLEVQGAVESAWTAGRCHVDDRRHIPGESPTALRGAHAGQPRPRRACVSRAVMTH